MYSIEILKQAREDLLDLFHWIAYEKKMPATAAKYTQGIYDEIKKTATLSCRFSLLPK